MERGLPAVEACSGGRPPNSVGRPSNRGGTSSVEACLLRRKASSGGKSSVEASLLRRQAPSGGWAAGQLGLAEAWIGLAVAQPCGAAVAYPCGVSVAQPCTGRRPALAQPCGVSVWRIRVAYPCGAAVAQPCTGCRPAVAQCLAAHCGCARARAARHGSRARLGKLLFAA